MQTPPRLLRTFVENRFGRPPLSEKQREREERILTTAQAMMAGFSHEALTIPKLALSLRMAPATIRHHFIDIETILAQILHRHLLATYRAIAKIPHEAPNRMALQRAAYLEATRHPWGGFTESHRLLLQKRHTLPEDLAKPIDDMRQIIGEALGGDHAETAFMVLDTPHLQRHEFEAIFVSTVAICSAPAAPAAPAPAAPAAKPAEPQPKPQPQAPAPGTHKPHFKNWKAARRQKSLMKQAARAARAGPADSSA